MSIHLERLRELYPNAPNCKKCGQIMLYACADCRCHFGSCCTCGNQSKSREVVPPRI